MIGHLSTAITDRSRWRTRDTTGRVLFTTKSANATQTLQVTIATNARLVTMAVPARRRKIWYEEIFSTWQPGRKNDTWDTSKNPRNIEVTSWLRLLLTRRYTEPLCTVGTHRTSFLMSLGMTCTRGCITMLHVTPFYRIIRQNLILTLHTMVMDFSHGIGCTCWHGREPCRKLMTMKNFPSFLELDWESHSMRPRNLLWRAAWRNGPNYWHCEGQILE